MLSDLFAGAADNQFRMVRFQLFNWGTFSGLHDIAISEKGHLFIGGSGSGKSTLLDAMSVLLTPGQINFNAAAREGERKSDRTIVSYMRGAWTTQQDDEGRSVVQFLRKGSTWSAIALTYKNANRTVTLMFVGIIRGNSNEDSKVTRYYYVIPHDVDIKVLSEFSELNYKWEFIRKQLPEAKVFPRFSPYCECFRKEFGIEEETVLKLLHKAQSARNLGDLNQFLRKFMLDVPRTYKVADLLVGEFTELYDAHDSVVKARLQVEVLNRAKAHYSEVLSAREIKTKIDAQIASLDAWYLTKRCALIDEKLPKLLDTESRLKARYEDCAQNAAQKSRDIEELTQRYYESGGDAQIRLEAELRQASRALKQAQAAKQKFDNAIESAKENIPQGREEFNALTARLKTRIENASEEFTELSVRYNRVVVEKERKSVEFRAICNEINALEKSPSNIPSSLQDIRSDAADALGLKCEDLPFVGELIDVKDEQRHWQGAIERVLHNFALSILVDETHYADFASWANDRHLGIRLVYQRVRSFVSSTKTPAVDTLPAKLVIQDGRWKNWVENELVERFSYKCVSSVEEFTRSERALTITGQVKHNRSRHEKDDRHAIGDRRQWVLGFNNAEKLALYRSQAAELGAQIADIERAILDLSDERDSAVRSLEAARHVLEYRYEEIDTVTLASEVARLTQEQETALAKNEKLETLKTQIQLVKEELSSIEHEKEKLYSQWQEAQRESEALRSDKTESKEALEKLTVNEDLLAGIDQKAELKSERCTLKQLPLLKEYLLTTLTKDGSQMLEEAALKLSQTTAAFSEFKQLWPDSSMELDATEASAPEFFEKLERLELEGLPQFESRFRELLNTQARQNLSDLYREIDEERRSIKLRLQEVNNSLAQVAFNRSVDGETHLKIAVSDKNLLEVLEFKKIQRSIMDINLDEVDRDGAERYFKAINDLVQRLNAHGKDAQALRWRDKVLDVREHMDFYGVEYEVDNGRERVVEVYQSGAGKSGGQRQKLTVICLAAALRYQLGGRQSDYPTYAPVILDEAFDKADSEFTDIALKIFKDFHFQMIIATPEKSVMTLDPYVGGTTFVSCRNRNTSGVINVVYDSKSGQFQYKDS